MTMTALTVYGAVCAALTICRAIFWLDSPTRRG